MTLGEKLVFLFQISSTQIVGPELVHNRNQVPVKVSYFFEMSFWCLQILPKTEQKQVILKYHSSQDE